MLFRGRQRLCIPLPLPRLLMALVAFGFLSGPGLASELNWESPAVHPVEMSPDGTRLFAVHTADHRVVIYDLTGGSPAVLAELPVGLEPVSVRARTNNEIWVVNHISDSISIIDLSTLSIVRTLLVGDEPTDVVFTGNKAFVCVSQLDLIRVYDTTDLDLAPADIPLLGADPRGLALSDDGSKLYVTVLHSGNNTTVVPEDSVAVGWGLPAPNPPMNPALDPPPVVGLIVKHDGTNWLDELARSWDPWIPYTLYDYDVFEIDTSSNSVLQEFTGVGTNIFNVAVNPVTDRLYVSNTEAFNHTRFEPNLVGQFAHNRVTTIDPLGPTVTPVHLNSHINYGIPAGDPFERFQSIGVPTDLVVNAAGTEVYVAGFGSNNVGVLDASGNVTRRITVASGPNGLALDEPRNQLYVWCRTFSQLVVVDLSDDSTTTLSLGYDPTPINVQVGRSIFLNTQNSSAHGDLGCVTCHTFSNTDGLAWNLGDPTAAAMIPAPQPQSGPMHPMKGPLMTQALKSLSGTEPLHWRGDNFDVEAFNLAFVTLQGRADTLSAFDMSLFKEYLHSISYPPNPNRNLDGSLPDPPSGPNPTTGENLFFTGGLVGGSNCDFCHAMPTGTSGLIFPPASIQENQAFLPPQLRNLYEKLDITLPQSISGFGFTHNGEERSVVDFFTNAGIFTFSNQQQKDDVNAFLLTFDTGTHAAVGAQLTMDGTNQATWLSRLTTLIDLADSSMIGLVAKGNWGPIARGWMYDTNVGEWQPDRSWQPTMTTTELLALATAGQEITFTAVVDGCEIRMGIDRDEDGFYDREELDAGTDPGDPGDFPAVLDVPTEDPAQTLAQSLRVFPNPVAARGPQIRFAMAREGNVDVSVYNVRGALVRTVSKATVPAGSAEFTWDLTDSRGLRVPGGIYFVRVKALQAVESYRLVVLQP